MKNLERTMIRRGTLCLCAGCLKADPKRRVLLIEMRRYMVRRLSAVGKS